MATIAGRRTGGAGAAARSGLRMARIVSLATAIVVGVILLGIVLVLLDANRGNEIVNALLDAGKFLVGPFDNVFKMDSHKANVGVNWGLAAVVYGLAGSLIAKLLRRQARLRGCRRSPRPARGACRRCASRR
jgi:hypothetical protein